jgi:hypothetical protein
MDGLTQSLRVAGGRHAEQLYALAVLNCLRNELKPLRIIHHSLAGNCVTGDYERQPERRLTGCA